MTAFLVLTVLSVAVGVAAGFVAGRVQARSRVLPSLPSYVEAVADPDAAAVFH